MEAIKSTLKYILNFLKPEIKGGEYKIKNKELLTYSDSLYFNNGKYYIYITTFTWYISTNHPEILNFSKELLEIKEEIEEPYVLINDEPLLKVTSKYYGGDEEITRDITKIVSVIQKILEILPEIKREIDNFIEEYKLELSKLPEPEPETKPETKIYSQKYNNVWFPIQHDGQLKAVLRKILLKH